MKINVTTKFATMVRENGKTGTYFHLFKIWKKQHVLATMEIEQWTISFTNELYLIQQKNF
jgi:hypothetical protein